MVAKTLADETWSVRGQLRVPGADAFLAPEDLARATGGGPDAADLGADVLLLELLELEVPDDEDLGFCKLMEERAPPGSRREWCVPAALLSDVAKVTKAPHELFFQGG